MKTANPIPNTPGVDFTVEHRLSIDLLRPRTEAGKLWLQSNLVTEDWQFVDGAVAVDVRMTPAIVRYASNDGLGVDEQ